MPSVPLLAATLLALGTAAPVAVRQPPAACRDVLGHMIDGDGDRTTILISERERCLEVRVVGHVAFTDDDADVRALDPGGSLVATEARAGNVRTLSLVERGGAIAREYRVNGVVQPTAESTTWFGGVVLDVLRETGFGAAERVARIRRQHGVAGVLDEVERLRSDHVRRIYLEQLLASGDLTSEEAVRAARLAADRIASDHERAMVLHALIAHYGADRGVADAAVRGAASMTSDHEKAEVLRRVLERAEPDDGLLSRALDAADDVGSDHERANVLATALDRGAPSMPVVRTAFFRALDGVGSDHERRRVLEGLASRDTLGTETLKALLASAARLGSDHEKAAVLLAVAWRPERLRDPAARAAFDAALKTIGSDAEYRRVAGVLVR